MNFELAPNQIQSVSQNSTFLAKKSQVII